MEKARWMLFVLSNWKSHLKSIASNYCLNDLMLNHSLNIWKCRSFMIRTQMHRVALCARRTCIRVRCCCRCWNRHLEEKSCISGGRNQFLSGNHPSIISTASLLLQPFPAVIGWAPGFTRPTIHSHLRATWSPVNTTATVLPATLPCQQHIDPNYGPAAHFHLLMLDLLCLFTNSISVTSLCWWPLCQADI